MSGVYVISAGPMDHKIGLSRNPYGRMRELQGMNANPLTLIFSASTRHAYRVEREAHDQLAHRRKMGEWFAVTESVALDALQRALYGDVICGRTCFPEDVKCGPARLARQPCGRMHYDTDACAECARISDALPVRPSEDRGEPPINRKERRAVQTVQARDLHEVRPEAVLDRSQQVQP